jgi:hypothetical protein
MSIGGAHGARRGTGPTYLDCPLSRGALSQGTHEANVEAEQLCQRAISVAPGYGQAHSLLAWALLRRTTWSRELRTTAAEISAHAQAALGLDDRDP